MQRVNTLPWAFGQGIVAALVMSFGFSLLMPQSKGEGIVTLTFDGEPTQPPGSRYSRTNYAERGTGFISRDFMGRAWPPFPEGWPDNGTPYLVPAWGPVNCTRLDGLSFRLISVDLSVYSYAFPDDPAWFEGHRSDGTIVTTNFLVSGLSFQTYYFSPEFADLTNVFIRAGALDNVKTQLPSIQPVLSSGLMSYRTEKWAWFEANGTLGLQYRLEYTEVLPETHWIYFTNFESSFSWGEHISVTTPPQRFFRVVELP